MLFLFLIPEIEKEINQTSEVIFGIGKKYVVVGLEKMGLCTSLGVEPLEQQGPWKGLAEHVPGRSGSLGGVRCREGSAADSFPFFPEAIATYGTFCMLWIGS